MPKSWVSIARIGIVGVVVGLRLWLHQDWMGSVLLVVGWAVGYFLAEADHIFYVAVCNPQEVSCQRIRHEVAGKNWRNAWGLLKSTMGERSKLPVHNVVTSLVVAILGLWLVTSSGSLLAIGVVVGLGVKLYSEFIADADYGKWYWLIARQFSPAENKTLKIVWSGLLLLQLFFLVRG